MKINELLSEAPSEYRKGLTVLHKFENPAQAAKAIKEHFSDSLWMVKQNAPFWRGTSDSLDLSIVDPTQTQRRSENTSNLYTIIFDTHPERANWPKRSRSLIATTNSDYASSYGRMYAVIPANGSLIGAVNRGDIWNTELKNLRTELYVMNERVWKHIIGEVYDIDDIEHAAATIAKHGIDDSTKTTITNKFGETFGEVLFGMIEKDGLMPTLYKLYSLNNLSPAHTVHTTKNADRIHPGEVWVSGPCLMLEWKTWNAVRSEFGIPG